MKRTGNVESNKLYNPRNVKAQLPVDADEVEGVMERYIRQKYEHRVFSGDSRPGTRHNTGSNSSVEDRPPPLPPKPSKKFGFGLRTTSSTFPSSRSSGARSPPVSPDIAGFGAEFRSNSPPRVNKASRVFGSNIERPGDSFDQKLTTLRDMGFTDERRNATVLKGLNGNLDKSVEALIRLGEGSRRPSRTQTPNPPAAVNGISVERTKSPTNPFDALDKPQPPPPQQLSPIQTQFQNSVTNTQYNPFFANTQPQQPTALDRSFQNMSLSQPQLYTTAGHTQSSPIQSNPFLQSFTPPPMPTQQYPSLQQQQPWAPQSAHPLSTQATGNPFLRTSRSQVFSQPTSNLNSSLQGSQSFQGTSPFASPAPQIQPFMTPQPQQQPWQQPSVSPPAQTRSPNPFQQQYPSNSPFAAPLPQTQPLAQPNFAAGNPFQQAQIPQQYQQPFAQQPQQDIPRPDAKTSIMALYNYPQLAPTQPATQSPSVQASADGQSLQTPFPGPQRSVTMPILPSASTNGTSTIPGSIPTANGTNVGVGAHNPFASANPALNNIAPVQNMAPMSAYPLAGTTAPKSQLNGISATGFSRESVDFAGLMAGRHSPDAFKGLSARWGVS